MISLTTSIGVVGVIEAQVEHAGLVVGADQILQGRHLNEFARAFAVLHDAGDTEFMIQHGELVADVNVLLAGEIVVDHDVIGTLEWTTFEDSEKDGRCYRNCSANRA